VSRSGTVSPREEQGPSFWRLNGINAFWFTSQGLWNSVYILLAVSAALIAPADKELVVGRATAAGGVLAVLVPIAAGMLSDRTRGRWGRRTPWILGGTAINLVGLGLLAWSPSVPALIAAFMVLQLGNNAASAAFAALIPDIVAEPRRGRASGLLNSASILGTIACLGLTLAALGAYGSTSRGVTASYAGIAALLVLSLGLALALLREPVLASSSSSAGLADLLAGTVASLRQPDFVWVIATRTVQTLGIWTILPFITFYFQDVARADNFGAASDLWLLVVLAASTGPALLCGYLSDRTGRRKLFVYLSSGLQTAVAAVLLFSLITDLRWMYALGIAFGVGYGAYSAVDWALACDVLPAPQRSAARDMALFHVAYTLPQVVAPALLAPALVALNRPGGAVLGLSTGSDLGFRAVFATATIWFVLATVMVRNIRGVR
jgi:Na+/melibiose symporter-like transporter